MAGHNSPTAPSLSRERQSGSVIALEGPEEVVATQLYLLPASPQIIVLPKIEHYIPTSPISHDQEQSRHKSDPRKIISTIHNAAKRRHSVAMEFLQHSTAERKRAVFLQGGTCGAKLMCLDAIGKAYTAGNLEKAAAIFDRLMSQGLKSLEDDGFHVDSIIDPISSDTWVGNPDANKSVWANKGTTTNGREEDDDDMEDPITKAMRAADALDRETENLQPPKHDAGLGVDFELMRPRSLSMSAVGFMAAARDMVIREREVGLDMSTAANTDVFQLLPSPLLFPSNPATKTSSLVVSPPHNTQGQLKKARSFPLPENLKDVKFNLKVDYVGNAQMDSVASKAFAQPWHARKLTDDAGIGAATTLLGSGLGTEDKDREWNGTASVSNYSTATPTTHDATHDATRDATREAIHVGSHTRVSSKPPGLNVSLRNFEKKPKALEGLDHEDSVIGTKGRTSSDETAPFEPLLPFNEHYVIHLSNGKPDDQFGFVSGRYKDGSDSIHPPPTSTYSLNIDAIAVSPRPEEELKDMTPSENNIYPASEYDPYRYEEQLRPQSTTPGYVFPASFPVTPSASRFHNISTHNKTAVWVQNTLRSVLDVHTPIEEIDYLSPDIDSPDPQLRSLWEPLMCAETDQPKGERNVDLILAIGAEDGVKKNFKQGVMAKIEQLGFSSHGDGMSRSGRLGLRYLIGNAMQTFTSQPLTQQSKENPFSNPTLLASLIIPHVDTYLRGNDNVRFLLIEYPVEHLSTMLAMQKLMGSQVMKVAGISKGTDKTIFSMADYRVSSVASVAEVSECVEAIRDTLALISDFYKPQTSDDVPTSPATDAVQKEKHITARSLSTKSSDLTNPSIAPLLPPQQHSPRHKPSPVAISTFAAMSTPPPPLLPVSPADTYNHTHAYVHSNCQNHGHGHVHAYMPTAAIHLPTRSISPPPCSHCSSTFSTSMTRSNTLISHGTVSVASPSVVLPQSPHSITRATSQRPSISGSSKPTPVSPSGSHTISPRTKIGTATTCVVQQKPPPTLVPIVTTSSTTPGAAAPLTTTRLQSPLSLSSGPLSSSASTSSHLSIRTDFNTDDDNLDSEAEDDDDDDDQVGSDEDPFDFFDIDAEERRLMPMFLKSQIEAHVAASGAATGGGATMGHRSPVVGNRELVDLETLLGAGRKNFGERFANGQGLQFPLPPDEVLGGRGSVDSEKRMIGGERQHGSMGKKQQQQQQHKKGSKKPITGRNSTETGSVIGLGALATALEAEEAWKPSKGLKERRKNNNPAPFRPMTPNPNMPDPGNGGGNNMYTRPMSRRTTTSMNDQRKGSLHSPGMHMGGEQSKALKWLGLA
ncbi:hypothetical protein NEUTE1DRAFT_130277 [Neurospora tetrasperma FGSC 2508]|uniref:Uncharacterized protein n=1 Tax=Neurospora tetrasperma (strain FGSC 2508 / ATCC MYA-4615 / P0657) TaxID=510951 RepID=F8MP99_NEUT8|nr:uncharacterized protein NEUTE1DRAFT_130277 [Neurospora tetrasperma FGSC 2508]EGO56264.1 hypothetical protein NEUTE1DRAFT_130277 [Neurospora tetrasperma FGSC 2508]EGZ70884.1 hypothetical protein NEUTE2DRAFT_159190 [Neurospora tetrasperma FGSC 2509]